MADDVLDVIAVAISGAPLPPKGSRAKAQRVLDALSAAGVVLVIDPSWTLKHGDELAIGSTPELFDGEPLWRRVRRSVPEGRQP